MLLAALAWAPWPLASNRPWALAVLGALLWVGLSLAIASRLLATGSSLGWPQLPREWWVPVVALSGFALLVALQLVPGLGGDGQTLSISPFHTRLYLYTTMAYAGGWLLVLLTVHARERASWLLGTLVATGVVQAVVAVALYHSRAKYLLWYAEFEQGGRTTGSFVNPDHLAGYMELTLAAGIGWLLTQFGGGRSEPAGRGWRGGLVSVLSFALSPKLLLRSLLVLMVIALVMTHSRMGNGAFFLALLAGGGLLAWRSQKLRKPALWLVASMAVIDIFIIGQWVGLERVVDRIQNTSVATVAVDQGFGSGAPAAAAQREESLRERLEVPRQALAMVAQGPWLGYGGGTFVTAFARHKQEGYPLYWTHAHNDYVQVAADTGWLGLALWLVPGVWTARRALRLLADDRSSLNRGIGAAAVMALLCMGMHSMVDFNLHIPANAMTFTVLLALAWAPLGPSSAGARGIERAKARSSHTPAGAQDRDGPHG